MSIKIVFLFLSLHLAVTQCWNLPRNLFSKVSNYLKGAVSFLLLYSTRKLNLLSVFVIRCCLSLFPGIPVGRQRGASSFGNKYVFNSFVFSLTNYFAGKFGVCWLGAVTHSASVGTLAKSLLGHV